MRDAMFYVAIGMPVAVFLVGLLWYRYREIKDQRRPTPTELIEVMQATHRRVVPELEDLKARTERLEAAFKSFRGQVYAWRGKLELDESPQSRPDLNDPKLSKAQVKAALGLTTPQGVAAFLKKPS